MYGAYGYSYAWGGSWWGIGAIATGTLILIALAVVYVAACW